MGTPGQVHSLSWVRTYNPSVRVGNWCEDLVLQEDQVKDFLERKDKGQLLIQRATNLLQKLLKPAEITKSTDGYLHVGDLICIMHVPTQSLISGHMSAFKAQEAHELEPDSRLTSSTQLRPCPRNIFVVGSYEPGAKVGDVVQYEQHITFTTLPGTGGNLTLESERATLTEHTKYTREQELKLMDKITYKSAWKVNCFNPEDRLEMAGMPVPVNEMIFINHCMTNNNLAVHNDIKPKTPFGREYQATAATHFNLQKIEDVHNRFMFVTGDYLASLIAKIEEKLDQ